MRLRYTLLADGSSDRTLLPLLNWLLEQAHLDIHIQPQFASQVPSTGMSLVQRIQLAMRLYPCDVLFIHRDAEKETMAARVKEIRAQVEATGHTYIPVVPVRMTEAWLLSSETAIRQAAGNPKGKVPLSLPAPKTWDRLPDPKAILFDALRNASELTGRRLKQFKPEETRHRVAEIPDDFSALLQLPAFADLKDRIVLLLATLKLIGH
jgi:hypothetical protein